MAFMPSVMTMENARDCILSCAQCTLNEFQKISRTRIMQFIRLSAHADDDADGYGMNN